LRAGADSAEPVGAIGRLASGAARVKVDDWRGVVGNLEGLRGIVFGIGVATNVALNVAQLLAIAGGLAVCAVYLRRLLADWRREHGLRTALAEVHGMAKALSGNAELPPDVCARLYAAMVEASGRALAQLDAGALQPEPGSADEDLGDAVAALAPPR
jgi:hypothetical protein